MSRKYLLIPALVLASALTACGGDDGEGKRREQLKAWAAEVCAPQVTASIDAAEVALGDVSRIVEGEQPTELKARLIADIAKLSEADTTLASALETAGDPQVKDGGVLRASVIGELRSAAEGWTGIRTRVEALPTDRQNVFADGLRGLTPEIDKLRSSSRAALDRLHTGEVGKALQAVPGCAAGQSPARPAPSAPATGSPSPSGTGRTSPAPSQTSQTPTPSGTAQTSSASPGAEGSPSASASPEAEGDQDGGSGGNGGNDERAS